MRNALFALLVLMAPIPAHAIFLDCLFFDGLENLGTTDAASLNALEVHDCARKTVIPAASPSIPILTWSSPIAATAQSWANGCNYAHGGAVGYGQNIYAGAGFTPTLASASLAWAEEAPDYDYPSNSCAAGKQCGHYTQIVWRSTTQVGCGQAMCTINSPFGAQFPTWYFIVCDYSPPGNSGQRPY